MFIFPVQLTTSRIGNLTRLIHTLLYVHTVQTTDGQSVSPAGLISFPRCFLLFFCFAHCRTALLSKVPFRRKKELFGSDVVSVTVFLLIQYQVPAISIDTRLLLISRPRSPITTLTPYDTTSSIMWDLVGRRVVVGVFSCYQIFRKLRADKNVVI